MKISACLIIRDEMANLPRLFDSLRPHVDEICVLDTGSTDGSAAWCRERADKWEQWTGCNDSEGRIADFSAARNRNLAMASHDVVFWIDGDDELVGGQELRKLASEAYKRTAGQPWSMVAKYNYDPTTVQWRERLVYPAKGFEWRSVIHEGLLAKAGTVPVNILAEGFYIQHRRRELPRKPGDGDRNLRILEGWFRANGEADVRLMHYFGAELQIHGRHGEALYWFRRHIACSNWSDEKCLSLMHIARWHYAVRDYSEAIEWAFRALAMKSWPEPCWMIGQASCALANQVGVDRDHNLRRGLHWLERGFRFDDRGEQRSLLMLDPTAKYEACEWFAPALAETGKLDEAMRFAELGLSGKPESETLRNQLVFCKKHKLGMLQAEVSELERATIAGPGGAPQPRKLPVPSGNVPPRLASIPEGKLDIVFFLGSQGEKWTPETLKREGNGGSETMAWNMASRLAKLGHRVRVIAHCAAEDERTYEGVEWLDEARVHEPLSCDILISSRRPDVVYVPELYAKHRILWVHDVHVGDFGPNEAARFDFVWCLSQWHKQYFLSVYPWLAPDKVEVTRNGIDLGRFTEAVRKAPRNPHRAIYSSSPDRGLITAVRAWPEVRKQVPDAELHVFYGFEGWERALTACINVDHPHCGRDALNELKLAIAKTPGVVLHGRVSQERLAEEMLASGVWFYPTWFSETSCITAMEAQAAGLLCVCPPLAALAETVRPINRVWQEGLPEASCITALTARGDGAFAREKARIIDDMQAADDGKAFSLDTLATDWEKRLLELVEQVVPAFTEAAQ